MGAREDHIEQQLKLMALGQENAAAASGFSGLMNSAKAWGTERLEHAKASLMFELFETLFEVRIARTEKEIKDALGVRFLVFCKENEGYEDPNQHRDRMETDIRPHVPREEQYDRRAEHIVVYYKAPDGEKIPCAVARLILPNQNNLLNSFPTQKLWDTPLLKTPTFIEKTGEMSRYSRSKIVEEYIRETYVRKFNPISQKLFNDGYKMITLGLLRAGMEAAMNNGIMNLVNVMTPPNIRILEKKGLVVEDKGQAVEHHGTRVPFLLNIANTLTHARETNYGIWKVVSSNGLLHERALQMSAQPHSSGMRASVKTTETRGEGATSGGILIPAPAW
ncbi:MAG: GNAT family N-acetyltransferase [Rhodospirillales bacterium]|nr:GNAT family N-acetyltransferase [Rhodospirillales bacterium]